MPIDSRYLATVRRAIEETLATEGLRLAVRAALGDVFRAGDEAAMTARLRAKRPEATVGVVCVPPPPPPGAG